MIDKALELLGETHQNEKNLRLLLERRERLIPFAGAGVARVFGYWRWNRLLGEIAGPEHRAQIDSLLAEGRFEEAAEQAMDVATTPLDSAIQRAYDVAKLEGHSGEGLARYLPRLAKGAILTTNLDRAVEAAFGFRLDVFPGTRMAGCIRAAATRQGPFLLKLHGDYQDNSTRILTLATYLATYGRGTFGEVDFDLAVPAALAEALGPDPLLFLGCSLRNSRTFRAVLAVVKRAGTPHHFALLPDSDNHPDRLLELSNWNIRPIFYPKSKHAKVEAFLALLTEQPRGASDSAGAAAAGVRMAPAVREGFVERPQLFSAAKDQLLGGQPRVALCSPSPGAGGYGATALAQALCGDRDIQMAYPDILWVGLGRDHPQILHGLDSIYRALTGNRLPAADDRDGRKLVAEALRGRKALLVIDDVWERGHLAVFEEAAPKAARLIITRVADILDADTERVEIGEMAPMQSCELLLRGCANLPTDWQAWRELGARLGHWAWALRLANGQMRVLAAKPDATLSSALAELVALYDAAGLRLSEPPGDNPASHAAAHKAIRLSLDLAAAIDHARFLELAVFPPNIEVPLAAARRLWDTDESAAENTLSALHDLCLIRYDTGNKLCRLHEIVFQWLQAETAARQAEWHRRLARSWGDPLGVDPGDVYAWRWLVWHMAHAGQSEDVQSLLLDPDWMRAKLENAGAESLISDYDLAIDSERHRLVQRALSHSAAVISRDPEQLPSQLFGRLMAVEEPGLEALRAEMKRRAGALLPLWPRLTQADTRLVSSLEGHSNGVNATVFSPDGHTLASGSYDKTIKLWDVSLPGRPRLLSSLDGHTGTVNALAFSPDGRVLASGSYDKSIKLWDVTSPGRPKLLGTLDGHAGAVSSLSFTPDGGLLVSGSYDKSVKLWRVNAAVNARLAGSLEGHTGWVMDVALSPDGQTLISASYDRTVKLWDIASPGRPRLYCSLEGHTSGVSAVACAPDGMTVASGSDDKTIKLWDISSPGRPRLIAVLDAHAGWVMAVAFSKDGKSLASASDDNTIQIWDVAAPGRARMLSVLEGHTGAVSSVAFSPDGRTLASGSSDRSLKLWDMAIAAPGRARILARLDGHTAAVQSVCFSSDGRALASGSEDRTVKLWNIATPEKPQLTYTLDGHTAGVMSVAFDPVDRILASGSDDKTLKLWDVATQGRPRLVCSLVHQARTERNWVEGDDYTQFWSDIPGADLDGHSRVVRSVAFRDDRVTLASGSDDKNIKLWDIGVPTRPKLLSLLDGHAGGVRSIAFSPDGRTLASGSDDKTIHIWDVAQPGRRRLVATLEDHTDWVNAVVFSADGKTLASGAADRTIRLWNLTASSGRPELLAILEGHGGPVNALAFSPDGKTLASGGDDRTVRLWDFAAAVSEGTTLSTGSFTADAAVLSVRISFDARFLAAGDKAGNVHFFEIRLGSK